MYPNNVLLEIRSCSLAGLAPLGVRLPPLLPNTGFSAHGVRKPHGVPLSMKTQEFSSTQLFLQSGLDTPQLHKSGLSPASLLSAFIRHGLCPPGFTSYTTPPPSAFKNPQLCLDFASLAYTLQRSGCWPPTDYTQHLANFRICKPWYNSSILSKGLPKVGRATAHPKPLLLHYHRTLVTGSERQAWTHPSF